MGTRNEIKKRRLDYKKYKSFIRHNDEIFQCYLEDNQYPSEKHPDMPVYKGGFISGQLGRCGSVICMASGGLYDEKALKEATELKGPTEFTIELWKVKDNGYHLKHTHDLTYKGCKWISAMHTGECSCCCGGLACFEYESQVITKRNDMECIIPKTEKYLSIYSVAHLEKYTVGIRGK